MARAAVYADLLAEVGSRLAESDAAIASVDGDLEVARRLAQSVLPPPDILTQIQRLRDRKATLVSARNWLEKCIALGVPKPRVHMAAEPSWSLAGDLRQVATDIERSISRVVVAPGAKDDKPLIYVSNPPRHGKSLLLDEVFRNDPNVCVISITYNNNTPIDALELASEQGAITCLCNRIILALAFDADRLSDALPSTGVATIVDLEAFLKLRAPSANIVLCIDEISKLTDHEANQWSLDSSKTIWFWKQLNSLQRPSTYFVRIVMTGFSENPHDDIAASDIACVPMSLSMVGGSEGIRVLAAEILWAYAVNNLVFPGFLWQVVKSTPGLVGTWAWRIGLATPFKDVNCASVTTFDAFYEGAAVPWASVLQRSAKQLWPLIRKFLIAETHLSGGLKREARNAEIATHLGADVVISPFALAVVLNELAASPLGADDVVFDFATRCLQECKSHAAGCHHSPRIPWRTIVQKKIAATDTSLSRLLSEPQNFDKEPIQQLLGLQLLAPDATVPGVSVTDAGAAFERFTASGFALRLELLRLDAPPGSSLFLPLPGEVGHICRADVTISVTLVGGSELAMLFSKSIALLMPSTVSTLFGYENGIIASNLLRPLPPASRAAAVAGPHRLCFGRVRSVDEPADRPYYFPTARLESHLHGGTEANDSTMHNDLVRALTAAAAPGAAAFDADAFITKYPSAKLANIKRLQDSLRAMHALVAECATKQTALVFNPVADSNPLVDTIALLPGSNGSCAPVVYVYMLEVKDVATPAKAFEKKLQQFQLAPLLLEPLQTLVAPVALVVSLFFGGTVDGERHTLSPSRHDTMVQECSGEYAIALGSDTCCRQQYRRLESVIAL